MAIIAMIVAVENRFIFRVSTSFVYQIVPRVIALIDLGGAGISHLQQLPASIHSRGHLTATVSGDSSQSKAVRVTLDRWREEQMQSGIGCSNKCGVISRSCSNVLFWKTKMNGTGAFRKRIVFSQDDRFQREQHFGL
jgi:hypothetical protein